MSIKAQEIAFVCYAVTDLKRSRAFYEGTLGLVPGSVWEGEDMGFIEYEMGPHTLAIGKGVEQFKPGPGGTVALEVENYDAAVASLKEKGISFIIGPHENKSCFMAAFNDPDGNIIMIHKRKK